MVLVMRRFLFACLGLLIILVLITGGAFYFLPRSSFPTTQGELRVPGLAEPVDVYRDSYGVPHIYAANSHDLFFAQGYVHAQDRFWQMDFWRHIGSARLSEMFGEATLETDMFLRTLGFLEVVERELEEMDADTRSVLQSYADGVNAYLTDHQGSSLSLEYAILRLINPGYRPEPWQIQHTLTWAKMMAWDLGGNMDREISRAKLMQFYTPEQLADLFPGYPTDHPIVLPDFHRAGAHDKRIIEHTAILDLETLLVSVSRNISLLDGVLGTRSEGIGSNNWVISGEHTATGRPLLANDPHLGVQLPGIWYENGLHCTPTGPECPYNVTGFSFASAPGVVVGFNEHIAWGVTNFNPDVQDLYIEKVNPDNPNQYEVNGEWVDMEVIDDSIQVAGGEPVEFTIRRTRHGPIISDTYGPLDNFDPTAGLDQAVEISAEYAIALRWTALDPSFTLRSFLKVNRAQNWDEFRLALQDFHVPSQNFVFADVDGNIGYQAPGWIPIRANGDGLLPVPGWIDDFEWVDHIPFEDLPHVFNPPQGYIVTANNAVVGPDYPYLLTTGWDFGYRAMRIVDLIENAPGLFDVDYMTVMQGDNKNLNAQLLLPVISNIPLDDQRLENARALLDSWDYQQHMDSPAAALFEVFWRNLLEKTFHNDLPEDYLPSGSSLWVEVVRRLVQQPESEWWNNKETPEVERRDDIFRQSFAAAVDELERLQGTDPQRWNWGDLHTVDFRIAGLGEAGNPLVDTLFNRGPFRSSGGSSIVNATGWDARKGHYQVVSLPSMRMIVDLGEMENSLAMHTTGQSGHAYHPNYIDMAEPWSKIEYHPMLWEDIETGALRHLRLTP